MSIGRSHALVFGGVAVSLALFVGACGSSDDAGSGESSSSSSSSSSTTTSSTTPPAAFAYQPVYPFANPAEVAAWQERYRTDGDEPWHLDAEETARSFVQFLGYVEIDEVGATTGDAQDAHVEVGYTNPDDRFSTAAVVHLVRYGSGDDVPWEVVGTDDTDFSLTTPEYGATVTSPMAVGGLITGVDEGISVTVLRLHEPEPLGTFCCVGGGGEGSPWSATVPFSALAGSVLVVSAETGGHVQDVERFTVTAARSPGG
jgi:hypothetical protein